MKSSRRNAGLTMAEMLVVVMIIIILMGVVFVAIFRYQRMLKHFESENAAKEIFVAAQNHLSAAENEGLLKSYRASASDSAKVGEHLGAEGSGEYVVAAPNPAEIMDLMLPFGSIDETVRVGGSYIIRYNLNTATVLEVFYSDRSSSRFGVTLTTGLYENLEANYAGNGKYKARRNATVPSPGGQKGRVLGWYNGEGLAAPDDYLMEPVIRVINGDVLKVEIGPLRAKSGKTLTANSSMSLIVTGVSSGAMKEFKLEPEVPDANKTPVEGRAIVQENADHSFVVTLDDVTREGRSFASVCAGGTGTFLPGENLTIRAVAFDNSKLSNIASSGVTTVNSLFATLHTGSTETPATPDHVTISSFRHLENLDEDVSSLSWTALQGKPGGIGNFSEMTIYQTSDLDWNLFLADEDTNVKIYCAADGTETEENCYRPIDMDNSGFNLSYEGQSYTIWHVKVHTTGSGGLFSTLVSSATVENLDLVNFSVDADTGAGALAASSAASISNVRAYNASPARIYLAGNQTETGYHEGSYEIHTSAGAAGGLVGSVTAGNVERSAAAVYVSNSAGAAGGLIGSVSGGTVKGSYAGGHTIDGRYADLVEIPNTNPAQYKLVARTSGDGRLNVSGTTAGGLIGTLAAATVQNCYSTCSASGTTAGGFVGSASGGSTDSACYCTGLVWGTGEDGQSGTRGAFAGANSGASLSGMYLHMANYRPAKLESGKWVSTTKEDLLAAVGSGNSGSGTLSALDESADTYNDFFTVSGVRVDTVEGRAYDSGLMAKAEKVNNVVQFGFRPVAADVIHLGDWPVFETLTVNK